MHSKELTRPTDMMDSGEAHSQLQGKRLVRDCHADHDISRPLDQSFDFIPAHTRHSSYHLAAATYVDPNLQADGVRSQHCLRLRTRERSCAIGEGGMEHFDSRGVCLWPSEDAPSDLLALLCPDSSTSLVQTVCDERSIIYSTSAEGLPPNPHMLILINFDPMIRFPYMTSLHEQNASTKSARKVLDAPPPDLPFPRPLVQNAEAYHQAIRQGYRFERPTSKNFSNSPLLDYGPVMDSFLLQPKTKTLLQPIAGACINLDGEELNTTDPLIYLFFANGGKP
ncbi:hypothetical protein N7460_000253 [Penicillium canescens]|uniref:Uncharacterized protein n=1 Tax=Penicillium canescens TaxID=5083 RepID=A0AAD6NDZ4_PENCN|nr:hypothetical protein N7460_000253 [Penicillium canescens]